MKTKGLLVAAIMAFATLLLVQPLILGHSIVQVDTITHLRWFFQFETALHEGWFLPRWAFASHGGLGDPTFLYYQPMLYYVASPFSWLGLTDSTSLHLAIWLATVLIGLAVMSAIPPGRPTRQRLAAAALLMACPPVFFLTTRYGALPWAFSMPFSLLFVLESVAPAPRISRLVSWLLLLILSHLLSAAMILLCTGLARLVFLSHSRQDLRHHLAWSLAVALTLALSAFFLFPAVSQWHLINPDAWIDDPMVDWHRAFAFPIISWTLYGMRWFALQWIVPMMALAMCILVIYLTRRNGMADRGRRIALVALAALLFSSELAYPLYSFSGFMAKIQWPYRFAQIALILASVSLCMTCLQGDTWRNSGKLVRGLVIGITLAYIGSAAHLQLNVARFGNDIPTREALMQGEFGQPEYLTAKRGPDWYKYLEDGRLAGECKRLGIQCKQIMRESHHFAMQFDLDKEATIRLPLFAFPAWRLLVDGLQQPLQVDPGTGLIAVALSPGPHRVQVSWGGLPMERTGRWVSLAAIVMLLAWMAIRSRPARV